MTRKSWKFGIDQILLSAPTLQRQTRVALFLAIVLPALFMAVFSYTKTKRNMTEQTLLRRQTVSHLAAIALQERFGRLEDIVKSLATRVRFRKEIEKGRWQDAIKIMEDAPKNFPMIDRIIIMDRNGVLHADTPALEGVRGKSFAYREWVQESIRSRKIYISNIYKRFVKPDYNVLAVVAPLKNDHDVLIGLLVLQIRIDKLFEWVKSIDVGPSGYVYLVDKRGNVAGHPALSPQGEVLNYSSLPWVSKVLDGIRGIEILFNPIEKEKQIIAYEPVPNYGWGVITQQPTATAFALRDENLRTLLLVYGLISIISCVTAYFLLQLISELKQSQETTRKTREFLETVLEHIPDTIIVKEAKGLGIVRINQSGENLLGSPRDSLLGKTDYDIFNQAEADSITSRDRAVLAGKSTIDIPEERIHARGKEDRIYHTKKVPIYDLSGKPEYLLEISEDITEKKQAEEARISLAREKAALAEAEKGISLRDDFISIASHELRTPLSALRIQLQIIPRLLKDVSFEKKDQFESLLQTALRQLYQFSKLVDELLEVSHISAGQMTLNLEEVDLSEVTRTALERQRAELDETGCSVRLRLAESVKGNWDPVRIEQVVLNLITNAMKYGAGRPIEITTEAEMGIARLTVRDHGIGISKEDREKIFERYQRVSPITKYRGLGLGLYISKQIVSAHGGSIRVESEGVGHGSKFIVELPLKTHLMAGDRHQTPGR